MIRRLLLASLGAFFVIGSGEPAVAQRPWALCTVISGGVASQAACAQDTKRACVEADRLVRQCGGGGHCAGVRQAQQWACGHFPQTGIGPDACSSDPSRCP
jgi:hypothetical protein